MLHSSKQECQQYRCGQADQDFEGGWFDVARLEEEVGSQASDDVWEWLQEWFDLPRRQRQGDLFSFTNYSRVDVHNPTGFNSDDRCWASDHDAIRRAATEAGSDPAVLELLQQGLFDAYALQEIMEAAFTPHRTLAGPATARDILAAYNAVRSSKLTPGPLSF